MNRLPTKRGRVPTTAACMIVTSLILLFAVALSTIAGYTSQDNFLMATVPKKGCVSDKRCTQYDHREEKSYRDTVEELRLKIALISIEMMAQDTKKAAKKSYFIDISPLYDAIEEALDRIGFLGVYSDLFERFRYAIAMTEAAKKVGIPHFQTEIFLHGEGAGGPFSQPIMTHYGMPGTRKFRGKEYMCNSCWWWIIHYVGAITADKLIEEGSLLLNVSDGSRLNDAPSVMNEIIKLEGVDYPDLMPFHVQHGFTWQYLARERPDLDSFPQDVAESFCGDLLWKKEPKNVDVSDDRAGECRHGFGHAVYAILARRIFPNITTARTQFRQSAGFRLPVNLMCEGYRICEDAHGDLLRNSCIGGLLHGYQLANNMDEAIYPMSPSRCLDPL